MLKVQKISISDNRATIKILDDISLENEQRAQLTSLISKRHKHILEHVCVNKHGPKFGDCVATTSLAHILEHLIIDGCISHWQNFEMIGTTKKRSPNLFEIQVTYRDDVELLEIINDSVIELRDLIREVSN